MFFWCNWVFPSVAWILGTYCSEIQGRFPLTWKTIALPTGDLSPEKPFFFPQVDSFRQRRRRGVFFVCSIVFEHKLYQRKQFTVLFCSCRNNLKQYILFIDWAGSSPHPILLLARLVFITRIFCMASTVKLQGRWIHMALGNPQGDDQTAFNLIKAIYWTLCIDIGVSAVEFFYQYFIKPHRLIELAGSHWTKIASVANASCPIVQTCLFHMVHTLQC